MQTRQNWVGKARERPVVEGQKIRLGIVNLLLIPKIERSMKNMSILYVHQWKSQMFRMRILVI
ncbi:hypothetical protein GCM10011328_31960 [Hafnia psychrotolerans]|uniref:Uncharacterized protein n=1 Tax=Hafnia psychrotolerans TaxID=1477018 RepID=A0ABQ1H0T5_9GAMM|nr:hypothetical protein GCM10011328_31960 [Hafnia psychrotolerans]